MFEVAEFKDDSCPAGFTPTKANADSNQETPPECIKLKDGMEKVASRLETRRVAAIKGLQLSLEKWKA